MSLEAGGIGPENGEAFMKLYYSRNLNPRVAVAVARYLKSPVEYVLASPRHPANVESFRAINPNALVPVLVEGSQTLWETDAIACRLSAISGSDFWRTDDQMPEMIKWISWSAYHLNVAAGELYFDRIVRPRIQFPAAAPSVLEDAMRNFRSHAAVLDGRLSGRTWLVGDHVSYADFRAATSLPFAEGAGLPLAEFAGVKRWHDRLWEIDAWRAPFDGLA
jgi:glutathione S-transferase